ncbi:MAG: response regulator [Gammaproteobacteria bacterium]|nr:response regulator [Gammaproteobacteria bacterium]
MAKKNNGFLKKLLATFAVEADEHLQAISAGLLELEKASETVKKKELIETIFREAHSLKGAARAVDMAEVESICQPLESVLAALQRDGIEASPELFDLLQQTVSGLDRLISSPVVEGTKGERSLVRSLVQRLEAAMSGVAEQVPPVALRREETATEPRPPIAGSVRVSTSKLDSLFRQAEEMISARLNAEQRSAELRSFAADLRERSKSWERIYDHLRGMQAAVTTGRRGDGQRAKATDSETLLEMMDTERSAIGLLAERFDDVTAAAVSDRRVLGRMIDNVLEDAKLLLMLPFSALFDIFPKLVRDLARDYGKEADFVIRGAEIEIDRRIQEEMKDPLIHIVRNCVGHGIEVPAVRVEKRKSARGTVSVTISRKDTQQVEIVIADDGAGIDPARVMSAAQKLGIVSKAEASTLSAQETISLVLRSGVSTSSVVTDIAGRGLGLAIVQEKVEKLGGSILVESQRDAGTTLRILLPLTLTAFRGVVIRSAERFFVVPTANVERVVRVAREDIKTVENRETIQFNGRAISLVRLADLLALDRKRAAGTPDDFARIVVLVAGRERIAFLVDEILNEQEVLLKGLGSQQARVRNIAGATLLGDGTIALVLNVSDLMTTSVALASSIAPAGELETAEPQGKSILVVEDSITARTLLKNILESSGYEVRTAVDGVDALTTLKAERFDLVVSDIEMPRMDGFDLTTKIRADRKLAELPVVLVTALSSREHRERGIDAGANAYIVKSNFDQTGLLEVIRRLI